MFELAGRRAVVTGTSQGIGKAIAIGLAQAGANVAGIYKWDPEGAEDCAAQVRAAGREAIMVEGDTGDPEQVDALARRAVDAWGGIDIWVNNAARLLVKPFLELSTDDWHGLLAANLQVDPPYGVETIPTPTAASMLDAAVALADVDIALLAAAVADYRPAEALAAKRPKDGHGWTVELAPTDDVAQALGERKRPGQVLVAFGAEHGVAGLERKRTMLETKQADLVVFNDVGRSDIGFDTADNEVVLVTAERERTVAKAAKSVIAGAILDEVERLLREVERLSS